MKSEHLVLGILADVDAGKTTLSENILFRTGTIRKKGRVDHGDTFLDTDAMERERGITIFARQGIFRLGEKTFTLLDTPGHADFSAETERCLSVLDYCILLISANEGVRSHVETLWKLIRRYRIPVFVFINKEDLFDGKHADLIAELNRRLGKGFVDAADLYGEETALLDDMLTERYLEGETLQKEEIRTLITGCRLFPCCFGSALKDRGIEALLSLIEELTVLKDYPEEFSAEVYKITREKNERFTHLKITGGTLRVKDAVGEEKCEQLRLFSGDNSRPLQEAVPGMVVSVTGPQQTFAGQGLGNAQDAPLPLLIPLFSFTVIPEEGLSGQDLYEALKELEEEIPELQSDPYTGRGEIRIRLMGAVQTEVIQRIMLERYGMKVSFGNNQVVYRETVTEITEGVGHFEPLRHYAEVHLRLEPAERGSGMKFQSELSEDLLPGHYQRLILSQLESRKHFGVLTGSELTDVKVTLVAGKHHIKHTVGGDFRQAAFRALRHGLMKNSSVLLEPWYSFEMTLPQENTGRAMSDITTKLCGSFEGPEQSGSLAVLRGKAPASEIQNYQAELTAYTKGYGRMTLVFAGYGPCHNPEEAIAAYAYDPDADLRSPSGSVFCEHGAGVYVPWQEVEERMHLPLIDVKEEAARQKKLQKENADAAPSGEKQSGSSGYMGAGLEADRELAAIFEASLGKNRKPDRDGGLRSGSIQKEKQIFRPVLSGLMPPVTEYLLVDGYNIIHAWKELRELASENLDSARTALVEILSDYQAFRGITLIVVFDAYRVRGGTGSIRKTAGIYEVYTKEAETADAYIEKTVHEIAKEHRVAVATSDGLEQVIIFGEGAVRVSAAEFHKEVDRCRTDIAAVCGALRDRTKNPMKLPDT